MPLFTGHICSCGAFMQAILFQTMEDNAVGQSQFQLLLYVDAPQDANMRGNTQLLHVVDQRTLPGEDATFPLVSSQLARLPMTTTGV